MQKLIILSLTILFFGINFVFADESDIDLNRDVYQYPGITLITPDLEITESGEGFDFKIIFEDGRSDTDNKWTGLAPVYENIRFGDIEKFDLDGRTIRVNIEDSKGNSLNNTQYNIISTGENKFETDDKLREKIYLDWYKQQDNWNNFSKIEQKILISWGDEKQTPLIPIEPIDTKQYHHIINNQEHYDPAQYVLEGNIKSNLFEYGEKFIFGVTTQGLYHNSISFTIRDKTVQIEEKDENIVIKKEYEKLTDEEKQQRSDELLNDIKLQQQQQAEQVLKDYEERKRLEALETKEKLKEVKINKDIPEIIKEEIIEIKPDIGIESTELIPDPEPIYITEPEPKCGQGTHIVNGYCKIIKPPKVNFFENFFKIFSIIFN